MRGWIAEAVISIGVRVLVGDSPMRQQRFAAFLITVAISAACSVGIDPSKSCVPKRDASGRIARSDAVRRDFMRLTGYPNGRQGYVIDHIIPLACCGPDTTRNLQWQTVAEARAKDRVELECRR